MRDRAVALTTEFEIVRTKQFTDAGIPRSYLNRLCQEGTLEKAGYGRYRSGRRAAA